jgi:hypothetical protein
MTTLVKVLQEELLDAKDKVKKLEDKIANLKKLEAEETKPVYEFTILPVTDKWDQPYDDSCKWYRIEGKVLNVEDCIKVGRNPSQGGYNYLYNEYTQRIVLMGGGGTIFFGGFRHDPGNKEAMEALGDWIAENPQGGIATEFVNEWRRKNR